MPLFSSRAPVLVRREGRRAGVVAVALLVSLLAAGCSNHYLVHPKEDPPAISTWSEEVDRGTLRMRLQWARPAGEGPFPAVLVHPEANHVAKEMRGILRSLALEGYLAVAADYRLIKKSGRAKNNPFTWRQPDDPGVALERLLARDDVDPERVATVGFSQGGVYSLLIAAYSQKIAAVVAYYPITDFETWLDDPDRPWVKRQIFKLVRRYFRRRSGALTDAEFRGMLIRASALRVAERIEAPVLLIHGDDDTTASVEESRRLERRLRELGHEVELLEIEGAGHVFNFLNRERAERAWQATLAWLDRHLGEPTRSASEPSGGG